MLPEEFVTTLPSLRGVVFKLIDQSGVASVFLTFLPLSEAKPAVCIGV